MLTRIDNFKSGTRHTKLGTTKPGKFLFKANEISALAGTLVHYACLDKPAKSRITPIFRLLDNFDPAKNKYEHIPIYKNFWLQNSLKFFSQIIDKNDYIPFKQVAQAFGTPQDTLRTYADATGPPSPLNTIRYGMGGLCMEQNLAWQMKDSVYLPFLAKFHDSRPTMYHISIEELLAQQFNKFFIHKTIGRYTNRICYHCFGDNEATQKALIKGSSKREFASALISLSNLLSIKMNSLFIHAHIPTKEMEVSGADQLSRQHTSRIFNSKVTKINREMFEEFTTFFESGTFLLFSR